MENSGRVLIVEPGPNAAEQLTPLLAGIGFEVQSCPDLPAACEQVRRDAPAIILLDARIARIDENACRKLRHSAPESRLPILLLVPPKFTAIRACLNSCDADDFICPPFQSEEVLTRVMNTVAAEMPPRVENFPLIDFRFLAGLSTLTNTNLETTQVLKQVVATISQVIEVRRCSITILGEDGQCGYVLASNDDPDLNGLKIDLEKYPEIREAMRTGKPLVIDNICRHALMEGVRSHIEKFDFNSLLVLPLVDKQQVFGVLAVHTARNLEGFSAEEISFCQLVANVAQHALRYALRAETPTRGPSETPIDKPCPGDFFETRGGLIDMAAHDLRLLVSVIDGYALLLQEADTGNLTPLQGEFIDGLMVGCQRMVELTNNLLDFSRFEAGKLELAMVETDLIEVIENASRDIQPMIIRRGIKLVTNSRQDQIIARCDVENIRRVFYNLMSNAVKFTPQGGQIELKFSVDEKDAFVSIADNGPGISPDLLPRLFDDFSHSQSPDGQHGNGIGLSICKRIVEAHQGRIWAENLPGKGSRFTFTLPRTK